MQEGIAVSVIMAAYNAEAHIKASIESILNQTFKDFELIIIDDCSTDNTYQIITSYQDKRIRLYRNEVNVGLTVNLNKGIDLSNGKYIARMDSDDISLPSRFQLQYRFMEEHPDVGVCGTWLEVFGDYSAIVKYKTTHREIALQFLYECHIVHPTVIMRKEVMIKNNILYNPQFVTAQDYDLFIRMSRVTKLANIPEALVHYRVHSESISTKKRELQLQNRNKIIANQFLQMGVTVTDKELDRFILFCNSKFDFDFESICRIEELLLRMIKANEKSRYLDDASLKEFLCDKWFHTCYNSAYLGIKFYRKYFSSELSNYQPTDLLTRAKFLIKSLLHKK